MSAADTLFAPERRTTVDRVVLDLPEPHGAYELFSNVSAERSARARAHGLGLPGQLQSRAFRTWFNAGSWDILRSRPGRICGPYTIIIALHPRRPETSKLETAVLHLLAKHEITAGPARRITFERNEDVPFRRIRVTVRPEGRDA